jgi:hypothetical protein
MQDELDRTIRATLDRAFPALDDVPQSWERIVADAVPPRRTPRERPRRAMFRAVAVGAVAAAVALGVLSVLPDSGPLGNVPGNGPSAVAQAADVIAGSADMILHTVTVTTSTSPDGSTDTGRSEAWSRMSPPYDNREISGDEHLQREIGSTNGRPYAYDAKTGTIATTAEDAVLPEPGRADIDGMHRMRDVMLSLLESGEAHEDGHVTIDGREAIRIVAGGWTLIIDAGSYEPIESSGPADDGTMVTTHFETYEWLPATEANVALTSVVAQHPDAPVEPGGITVEGFGGPKGQ